MPAQGLAILGKAGQGTYDKGCRWGLSGRHPQGQPARPSRTQAPSWLLGRRQGSTFILTQETRSRSSLKGTVLRQVTEHKEPS